MTNSSYSIIVLGGGAAGFFAALAAKEAHPKGNVLILEKTNTLLAKVRISGGGRCNLTHACFNPKLLVLNYPRGHKELLGPFYHFQPKDTVEWFESRGVPLKKEDDGRMFPVSNSSQSIIDCLINEAEKKGVKIHLKKKIEKIQYSNKQFTLYCKDGFVYSAPKLVLATGSQPKGHDWAQSLGHTIQRPVPSLFTFNVPNSPLSALSGIAFKKVSIRIQGARFTQTGPFLITHFGFSGPAVLKLSAWAARFLNEVDYRFKIVINWLDDEKPEKLFKNLQLFKKENPHKTLSALNPCQLPKKFWKVILSQLNNLDQKCMRDISSKDLQTLAQKLCSDYYSVAGKTTHKEEFVTCGGVSLAEVNFKTMESKKCPGLFFAGEILDIDGVTGGFNFQNAWTTGFIAGSNII